MEQDDINSPLEISRAATETGVFTGPAPLPEFYSEQAIYGLAVLFPVPVLFGAILLSLNCWKLEGKDGFWEVLLFGILYSALEFMINDKLGETMGMDQSCLSFVLLNILGAVLLKYVFWNRCIGRGVRYIKKPILKPVLVGFLIFVVLFGVLLLLTLIYGPGGCI